MELSFLIPQPCNLYERNNHTPPTVKAIAELQGGLLPVGDFEGVLLKGYWRLSLKVLRDGQTCLLTRELSDEMWVLDEMWSRLYGRSQAKSWLKDRKQIERDMKERETAVRAFIIRNSVRSLRAVK